MLIIVLPSYTFAQSYISKNNYTEIWAVVASAIEQNYDPPVLTLTTAYYRQVQKGNGCTSKSNVVVISVNLQPSPVGVFYK
jgi:hypothetical protein